MSASLESYVNRPVSVITSDGRNFVGTLKVSSLNLLNYLDLYFHLSGLRSNHQFNSGRDSRESVQPRPGRGAGDHDPGQIFFTEIFSRLCWVST